MLGETSITQLLLSLLAASGVLILANVIHDLYFSSLSKYPGPRLWAISRLPYARYMLNGRLVHKVKELHDQYGPIIRIAPDELSFLQAWQDIYGHHQTGPNLPKNPLWMGPGSSGVHSILSANDADHSRYRRLLSHAFSERALIEQEDLILSYIQLLMKRLGECVAQDETAVVDLVKWLNFTTFDIIGDLALGDSFDCLRKSQLHGWVSLLFAQFKSATLIICFRFYGLDKAIKVLMPNTIVRKRKAHADLARDRIRKRLDRARAVDGEQRNDFMTYVLRYNDEKGMTIPEIEQTMRVIVVAGSETTATALSGIVRHLLQHPEVMQKAVDEIRGRFQHVSEIASRGVTSLPYLGAIIEEGLRLCPPVPLGMPRIIPKGGASVAGQWLDEGISVSAPGYAYNRSELNFPRQTDEFDPSRWLKSSPETPTPIYPFSLGPRGCLGRNLANLEMRLILAHLLWTFDIQVPDGETLSDWSEQRTWILWDKQPLRVRLFSRPQ